MSSTFNRLQQIFKLAYLKDVKFSIEFRNYYSYITSLYVENSRIKYDSVKTIVVEERERERKRESKKQKLPRQINLINRSRFMDASRSRKTRNNITDYLL